MKALCLLIAAVPLAGPGVFQSDAQCYHFTHEHVDLLSVVWNAESEELGLMASDDTHGGVLYASNQCVVVAGESSKFTLPAGTPFGNEGDPLWILPQNPYAGLPYVGVSAERLPPGTFNEVVSIRLTRVEGPGHFMLWQSSSFGGLDIKMDSRNGVGAEDVITPQVGGHEHHNWGFTTTGVYRVYFQASGVRTGQATNSVSPETPFTFQVLPLRPFESWVATNWPCECATNVVAAGADPDADGMGNILEYAFGLNPHEPLPALPLSVAIVNENGTNFGAALYQQAIASTDLSFAVRAADTLGGPGTVLTNIVAAVTNGPLATITVRDSTPQSGAAGAASRFYRLDVRLHSQ